MKTCNKCKESKELNEFYFDTKNKDGFKDRCKTCLNNVNKEWYKNNVDKRKEYLKEYKLKNKEVLKAKRNIYEKSKRKYDPLFKLSNNIKRLISMNMKRKGHKKNSKTQLTLGCTNTEFKLYLESKFEHWMSWDNYGLYNGELNYGWDIDHIIPCSSALNENELLKLNHYTNLTPLCSKINRDIKRDKII